MFAQLCRDAEGLGDRQDRQELFEGPSPGTSLLRWLGTEGSVDPGSLGPRGRHAFALPGALTLKGHRVAEQACVSLRPQTGMGGQTDNVRGRNTALRQVGRRQLLLTPGSPEQLFPLSATNCHMSLGHGVRETVSYVTQWRRPFLKERRTERGPPCTSACWPAEGSLQLEPSSSQALCTGFRECGSHSRPRDP